MGFSHHGHSARNSVKLETTFLNMAPVDMCLFKSLHISLGTASCVHCVPMNKPVYSLEERNLSQAFLKVGQ